MSKQQTSRILLTKICICGILVALAIVFCRLLGFPTSGIWRVELSFLPIFLIAYYYGPIWAGACYGIADLIGAAIFTGINPFITLTKIAFGALLGLFFYRVQKASVKRILLSLTSSSIVLDFLAMSIIFILAFGYTKEAAFFARSMNALVNLVIRIPVLFLTYKFLIPVLKDFEKRHWSSFHSYANSFQYKSHLGLEQVKSMLNHLGNPEKNLKVLHVGGTNGKGSVVTYLDSMLRCAGYKVGRYMSPSLVRVNERIAVNGEFISDKDMNALFKKLENVSKIAEKETGLLPSQFEIWTAAAFLYFAECKCDYVVMEVGMGGAYDATNILTNPLISILTTIDLDHMAILGNTIGEIAQTKCGIFKEGSMIKKIVSAPQKEEAKVVIEREATSKNLTPIFVDPPKPDKRNGLHEVIDYKDLKDLEIAISGVHQIENACVAIEVALQMGLTEDSIRRGLLNAHHPARFEILLKDPLIIYDGGHNPNGIGALTSSLDRYLGPETKRSYIFACMADKDIAPSLLMLAKAPSKFYFCEVENNHRSMKADTLTEKAKELGINGTCVPKLQDAIELAKNDGNPVVICGSLYLYCNLPKEYQFGAKLDFESKN